MSLQYDYDHPGFQLYEELEVSPRASDPVIRAAYGRLMRTHAADRVRCIRLQTAFDILSNSTARRAYDAQGAEVVPTDSQASGSGSGGAAAGAAVPKNAQIGLILALSLMSGVLGGLEVMRLLAARGALPFG